MSAAHDSSRLVFLDTETTGLKVNEGDRIIEIGAVACLDRQLRDGDKFVFQVRVDPEREVPEEAVRIHGITTAALKGKPKFAQIAGKFIEFIRGSELVIHNAPFDCGFLDRELTGAGLPPLAQHVAKITGSLTAARALNPGGKNDLDNLCRRMGIDVKDMRKKHSALIDAQLLAKAYLLMTGGQGSLMLEVASEGLGDNMGASSSIKAVPWRADNMSQKSNLTYLEQMRDKSGVAPIMLSWEQH
ncbi:MAG: DNA polymerase III subunit epsilon [Betaproteobacteria bacterium]|nr:DNA polymerase III subunit epsilon [Betaproteobacteria bacterium]